LLTELLGNTALFAQGGLVVERVLFVRAQRLAQLVGRRDVHADKQAAALTITARPAINVLGKMPPAAQVEVSDTEIRALSDFERLLQGREQRFFRCCRKILGIVVP
jgi:hypothetical protein